MADSSRAAGLEPAAQPPTANCATGAHRACGGYLAPLVYANARPCSCSCHLSDSGAAPLSPRWPILAGESIDAYNARLEARP